MIPYRIQQVIWVVSARPLTIGERTMLNGLLSAEELALFQRLSVNDQNHSLRVLRLLQNRGETDQALLGAALLHDIGKTRTKLTVVDRSMAVAGKFLFPQRTAQWGTILLQNAARYQRPFVVRDQHARWGAEMVAAVGGDPLTVELIRRHQDEVTQPKTDVERQLIVLQWADNQA